MKKKRFLVLICFIISISISCKKTTDFSSIVKENKIIFIGENHSIINPRLFLIDKLDELYDLGVKHICMEGFTLRTPEEDNYNFYCFFPWLEVGSKYEDVLLSEKIISLNKTVNEKEKIRIYNPEEKIDETTINNCGYYEKLNRRDEAVFLFIEDLYNKIPKDEKILIFYGYQHGSLRNNAKNWKTLGERLNKKHNDFVSLNFDYTLKIHQNTYIQKQNQLCKYNYLIKQNKDPLYGICYQFYCSKENTQVLINHLLDYTSSNYDLFNFTEYDYLSNERDYLNCIYYLSMIYNKSFHYYYWNTSGPSIEDALTDLQEYNLQQKIVFSNNVYSLRNYHKYIILSDINNYIQNKKSNLKKTKKMLQKAYSYYKNDVWCLYWLARIEFELKDYDSSIKDFEECLNYESINNIEVLPSIYEYLINLYEMKNEDEKKSFYEELLSDIDITKIQNVRKLNDIK